MELHRLAACAGCGRQFDLSAGGGREALAPGARFRCSCGGEVEVPAARSESAAVVACSSCGGPRQGGEAACRWCGADFTLHELELDAICPRCAARVRRHGAFCHHCALPLTAPDEPVPTDLPCPACAAGDGGERPLLASRRVGEGDPLHLFECRRCAGFWLDRDVFRALAERARHGRSGLPLERRPAGAGAEGSDVGAWSYRPCPVCSDLMNRRNYGRRSGVIVDLCGRHGVWLDHAELTRVLEWVRAGGATEAEAPRPEPKRWPPPPFAGWDRDLTGGSFAPGDRMLDGLVLGDLLAQAAAFLGRRFFD